MQLAKRLAVAMLVGLFAPSAHAGYVVDLTEQGGNVVATGSGAIDLTGLTFNGELSANPAISPDSGEILTGPASIVGLEIFIAVTGLTSFGGGSVICC